MEIISSIQIRRNKDSKISETDLSQPGFGKTATDHMYIAEYRDGKWQNEYIEPFEDLLLSPFSLCLHYGQTVFEGMKAFRMKDGNLSIFRPDKHHSRFNNSLRRMCMPEVPYSMFINALSEFLTTEQKWIPSSPETSLYLRPFMIATESRIGATVSDEYLFIIAASPSGPLYHQPLKVKVETKFSRAVDGGTGFAKCGGNYGAALYPTKLAKEEGYDQVLWTDATYHQFIEESGMMNILFIIDSVLITPPLDSGTILDGITRASIIQLARMAGTKIEERKISYYELILAFEQNKRVEAFGAGTAAVVAPIKFITIKDKTFECYTEADALMYKFKKQLMQIQTGQEQDVFGWNYIVEV